MTKSSAYAHLQSRGADPVVERVEGDVAQERAEHAPNNVAKSSLIPDSVISRTRLRPKYGQGWQPRLDPRPRQADSRDLGGGVDMMTSSRRRALGVAVTRHYEVSRLQEQSIACAYEALMPVISSRSRCPHEQAGDLPEPRVERRVPNLFRGSLIGHDHSSSSCSHLCPGLRRTTGQGWTRSRVNSRRSPSGSPAMAVGM